MSFLNVFSGTMNNAKPIQKIEYGTGAGDIAMQMAQYQQQRAQGNNGTPKFGIKAKAPLSQDTFEKSEKTEQKFNYKGKALTKSEAQKQSYSDVYKHEAAHLSKAGKYATTGIVIDKDENGIATSGHVGISMPTLNPKNPKQTIEHANAVIASAEAPASFDELSGADIQVAANARAVKAQALNLLG